MPDITAETAFVEHADTVTQKAPVKPSVPLPDHPIRHKLWYQLFDRLWRPTLAWVACPIAVLYACVIAPASGHPLSDGYLVQVLLFAGGVYGLKTYEKKAGVA